MRRLIVCTLLLAACATAQAETRYVTDLLKVTLRSGASLGHRIVKMLPSGTAVEVLRSDKESGYSEVRTENGTTGWILTNQLMNTPSARDRLVSAEAKLAELQAEPEKLGVQLVQLREQHEGLSQRHADLEADNRRLEQDLTQLRQTSENAVRIAEERNTLRTRVSALDRKVQELEQKNRDLSSRTAQNWFMIGAGVIVIGIILGLILPHMRFQRKRDSWGSL